MDVTFSSLPPPTHFALLYIWEDLYFVLEVTIIITLWYNVVSPLFSYLDFYCLALSGSVSFDSHLVTQAGTKALPLVFFLFPFKSLCYICFVWTYNLLGTLPSVSPLPLQTQICTIYVSSACQSFCQNFRNVLVAWFVCDRFPGRTPTECVHHMLVCSEPVQSYFSILLNLRSREFIFRVH